MLKTQYIHNADKAHEKANELLKREEKVYRKKMESAEAYHMGYQQAVYDLLGELIKTEVTNDNT